ncbi:MAG: DMT family transporter [Alphaproteobacteria bacterium]
MTLAAAKARWIALPGTTRGILWMLASAFAFTAMLGTVKPASQNLHPFEVTFFRHFFTLLIMLPWMLRLGVENLRTKRFPLIALRGLLGFISTVLWFYAVPNLALADATAINFTAPLWATVFAALILHEPIRLRRWTATAIGFTGVLVVLRPGFQDLSVWALVMLFGAACWGSQHIVLKTLSRTEPTNVIVCYHAILLTPAALILSLFVWRTPGLVDILWLVALGSLGTVGHLCLARSFAAAEASVVLPFDFSKMPIAAAIGYVAFDEHPDLWTWAGAALIVAAATYIARREAQIARTNAAAAPARSGPPGTA